jgi:hypothetical protein
MADAFALEVERAFGFLLVQGFVAQPIQSTPLSEQVALRSSQVQVLACLERGGALAVYLAKAVDDQGPFDMDEVHPLADLVQLTQGLEAAKALEQGQPDSDLSTGLDHLAEALKACGPAILSGDDKVFGALADQRVARKRRRKERFLTEHHYPPEAWGR